MPDIQGHTLVADLTILNFLGVLVCTIYGGLNSEWDTISQMVTSDDKLRNGFAVYLVISACLIFIVSYTILQRAHVYGAAKWAAYGFYLVFLLTYIGFGVVSTDIDTDIHTSLAIVAFTSLLCMTAIFIYFQLIQLGTDLSVLLAPVTTLIFKL